MEIECWNDEILRVMMMVCDYATYYDVLMMSSPYIHRNGVRCRLEEQKGEGEDNGRALIPRYCRLL